MPSRKGNSWTDSRPCRGKAKAIDAQVPPFDATPASADAELVIARSSGAAIVAIGLLVITGWLFRVPVLTQLVPGYTSMVFSTALCFELLGAWLVLGTLRRRPAPWVSMLFPAAVLCIASLCLASILLDRPLGTNLPALHRWLHDGNQSPGKMSFATAVSFILASCSALLRTAFKHGAAAAAVVGHGLTVLVFCAGAAGTAGYFLNLEVLYRWYAFSGMAMHTAVCMMLLSAGLWNAWKSATRKVDVDEIRITNVGTWSLIGVAILTAVSSLAILKNDADHALLTGLQIAQRAQSLVLLTTLQLRSTRVSLVAGRPELAAELRLLTQNPDDEEARRAALEEFNGLLPYGFSSIALQAGDGSVPVSVGQGASGTELALPLWSDRGGDSSLVWNRGFVLRNRTPIRDGAGRAGYVVTEQPLGSIREILFPSAELAAGGEMELCGGAGAELVCFPNSRNPEPYRPTALPQSKPLAIQVAAAGEQGVGTFTDTRGRAVIAAYGPIGNSGLLSSLTAISSDFYAPLRVRLFRGFLLVTCITAFCAWWLRSRIRPLATRMAVAERTIRSVLGAMDEGVVSENQNGDYLTCNSAAERILGLTAAEIGGHTATDSRWRAIHEDGSPWRAEDFPIKQALRSGRAQSESVMGIHRPDGTLVWISIRSAPVVVSGIGSGHGAVATFTDITQRRHAEELLRRSEQNLRLLIDSVQDHAIFMLDAQGCVSSWSRPAERINQYSAQEIIGRPFALLYTAEEGKAGVPAAELEAAQTHGHFEVDTWRTRKDGSRFHASVVITALRDEKSNLLGFSTVTRDLSERTEAARNLAQSNQLREIILEAAPFSIIAADIDGAILSINPATERMLQYSKEELVGHASMQSVHDPQEILTRSSELSQELGRRIEPGFDAIVCLARGGNTEEREWTYIRKDGFRIPVHLAVTVLRDLGDCVTGYLGIAYDITERRLREDHTRHVAHHDFLTGLPNRTLLYDRLDVAVNRVARGNGVAVLMLDLDHFKAVNDTLGHHVGDQLLVTVAKRIVGCVRASDTVARLGGDEFVAVLCDLMDPVAIERIATNIVEAIAAPMTIGARELMVTSSVGISRCPGDAQSASMLLENADVAMYHAKTSGRAGYRFFDRAMSKSATAKIELDGALRRAVREHEFTLQYQARISLSSGAVVGVEALLRWQSPAGDMMAPSAFLPLAEEIGLTIPIGEWLLRTARDEMRRLRTRAGRPLKLSINLTRRQFLHENLINTLRSIVDPDARKAGDLELEICGSVLLSDADAARRQIRSIAGLGIGIAIDDFGSGYSSLAEIARLPIATFKLGRSLIGNISKPVGDDAVLDAVIALAKNLGISVCAQGIETAQQLALLRARRCDLGQGFYLGEPEAIDSVVLEDFDFNALSLTRTRAVGTS